MGATAYCEWQLNINILFFHEINYDKKKPSLDHNNNNSNSNNNNKKDD